MQNGNTFYGNEIIDIFMFQNIFTVLPNFLKNKSHVKAKEKNSKTTLKIFLSELHSNSFIKVLYLSYIYFISHILDVWENEWLYKCLC